MSETESYAVEWAAPATRALGRLPEKVAAAVVELVYGDLIRNPYRIGRPLRFELEGKHSARRGDYRVVYCIDDDRRTVVIEAVAHRSDAYRHDDGPTERLPSGVAARPLLTPSSPVALAARRRVAMAHSPSSTDMS